MYKLLIVDDEPLVQVGLQAMLERSHSDNIRVSGTATNGKDALNMIDNLHPDIVIADIRMPVMSGLELLSACSRKYGAVPAFIMLTAYEEFDMVRAALSCEAVDYLVKIELDNRTLTDALNRAIRRVDANRKAETAAGAAAPVSLEEFRQKFMLRLFSHLVTDQDSFYQEAADLELPFSHYDRFLLVYCQINADAIGNSSDPEDGNKRLLTLYSSCLSMSKEIVERYFPCLTVSIDTRHFAIVFYFGKTRPIADVMRQVEEAIDSARSMIQNYFNVPLLFGIGTVVSDAMEIPTSYEEARTAEGQADDAHPVRLFSHIVGANRRSGKDKLIASIQEYIDKNLNGRLQLSEVAEAFGLSPAYLSVIFKKNTDIGFSEYVNVRKIEKAKEMLLSGDMRIYEVADALGFESAYYFSKVFKKIDGHSPREYIQSKSETPVSRP
ncbi:two-component system, response regulator YesN [Lachnospiraceae bacterium NK3A20]|nr:two-component system, response regulator YesN [Lachnospiraceae bacterium NK3A20]